MKHFLGYAWLRGSSAALLVGALAWSAAAQEEPAGLFLTWRQDPTTTMTIDWHTEPGDEAKPTLYFRPVGEVYWRPKDASEHEFPWSDRTVWRVELTGLDPATEYRFRTGEFTREYKFRTMPEDIHEPLRFAAGGDTWYEGTFEDMNNVVMEYDPEFIVWGGDLAYADSREDRLYRWISWFDRVRDDLVAEDGRVVPIILAIGNHEMTNHHYPKADMDYFVEHEEEIGESTREWREENARYFYALFAFPGHPGYGVLDFGDYLSLISLDSSHSNLIGGKQTDWLEEILKERKGMPHIIPFYHKHAYPSHRVEPSGTPTQIWSEQVREYWVPLFEKYGVRVALENDDHTYKRTYPLRGHRKDSSGIVYIGDGAWGVGAREPKTPEEVWYLKRSAQRNHAIIVTLHGPHQHFLMVDSDGEIFDEYPQTPR